jgi:DNA-binding NarL/FixJ family response regulator
MSNEKKLQVLLCDDSAYSRSRIGKILQSLDCDIVAEAEDAEKSVKLYREKKPDLVIMDLVLRASTGQDAIRGIFSVDSSAKIIVVTILNDDKTLKGVKELGVSGIVNKKHIDKDLPSAVNNLF